MTTLSVSAEAVRRFRFRRHQLDRDPAEGGKSDAVALLDYAVQDTGPDGAAWALAIRGASPPVEDLVYAWTLRGAPHAYRRGDVDDAVEIRVKGGVASTVRAQRRFILAEDAEALTWDAGAAKPIRLLGPYDPYPQLRDRTVLVADEERRKALWPVIGRPGAVVADGDVLALWRPRTSGQRLRLAVEPWTRPRSLCAARSRNRPSGSPPTAASRWPELPMVDRTDTRRGLELVGDALESTVIEGRTYWFAASDAGTAPRRTAPRAHLLQVYDEYVVAYRESRDLLDIDHLASRLPDGQVMFLHAVILDGQVIGHWRRQITKTSVIVETQLARPLSGPEAAAVEEAVARQGAFVGLPAGWVRSGT